MAKDATISSRIDKQLKQQGDEIFASLGIKPSQALTMFYTQVVAYKGIPFPLKVPNAELIQSFGDAENTENLVRYPDAKTAINDMWNND